MDQLSEQEPEEEVNELLGKGQDHDSLSELRGDQESLYNPGPYAYTSDK